MCQKPSFIWVQAGPGYEKMEAPCRDCWQCRSNRINGYVGRALAESATSDWTFGLTLTYRPRTDLCDKIITPAHFAQFMRNVRKRRPLVRMMVAGEIGENGTKRVHFHVLLFGKGKPLSFLDGSPWPHQKNFHDGVWSHGHMYLDRDGDEKAARYICKYLHKDDDAWFSLSTKPAIGFEWFAARAREHVQLGILPTSFEYQPPGGQTGRRYLMTRTTKRDFLLALVDELLDADKKVPRANEIIQDAIAHAKLWRTKKQSVDLSLQDMIDRMRDEQGKAEREWSGSWYKDFQRKQEEFQCLDALTDATTYAEVRKYWNRAIELRIPHNRRADAAPRWLNVPLLDKRLSALPQNMHKGVKP